MGWVSAGDYEVALDGGKVVCRNASGRRLKSVPAKIGDDPAVVGLRQLVEWLERHERQCLDTAERWMVRSLPVPLAVVTRVWPDPAWRAKLRDLVVTGADGQVAGFLRDADPERGLGLVDLDGDPGRSAGAKGYGTGRAAVPPYRRPAARRSARAGAAGCSVRQPGAAGVCVQLRTSTAGDGPRGDRRGTGGAGQGL